jgi:hypothetical protein
MSADPAYTRLAELAMRMACARRIRINASRYLNGPWKGIDPATRPDSKIEQARHDLSAARIEWRKASTALWRLAEKIERGET